MATKIQKLGAYARLLRLSNAPTAVADVWMGYAVASHVLVPSWPLAIMSVVSLLLYHAGMVGNDIADVLTDRAEGRDRPLATQAIAGTHAVRLGWLMEAFAVALAVLVSWITGLALPLLLVAFLWTAIRWYNSRYKLTLAGPLLMGLCRLLNVQLGCSIGLPSSDVPPPFKGSSPPGIEIASDASVMIGIFIVGVTLFARNEAVDTNRFRLAMATAISAASFTVFGYWNWPPITIEQSTWWLIWVSLALFATRGMFAAILQPTPKNIGRGVGIAIQGLIVIDAVLAAVYAGPTAGLAIFALLPVTMLLSKWIPQT